MVGIAFLTKAFACTGFKKGKLQLSAQVSAVALKKGTPATASYKNGVAIFTLAQKGLMGELSVGGQKLTFEPAKKE